MLSSRSCCAGAGRAPGGLARLEAGGPAQQPRGGRPATPGLALRAADPQRRPGSRRTASQAVTGNAAGGGAAAGASGRGSSRAGWPSNPERRDLDESGFIPLGFVRRALALLGCPQGLQAAHPWDVAERYAPSPGGAPYYVYCLVRTDTGRYYIGCTNNPRRRYGEHADEPQPGMRDDARELQPFAAHFEMRVLAEARCKKDAELLEEYFIWKWNATSKAGYNTLHAASQAIKLKGGQRGAPLRRPRAPCA